MILSYQNTNHKWRKRRDSNSRNLSVCFVSSEVPSTTRPRFLIWCPRRDSNSQAFRHWLLRPACIPIPPQRLIYIIIYIKGVYALNIYLYILYIWCRLSESNTLYLTKPDYKSGAIPLCASRQVSI